MVHGPLPSVYGHVTSELGGAPGGFERHRHGVSPAAAEPGLVAVSGLGCSAHDRGPVEFARDDQWATVVADGQVDGRLGSELAGRAPGTVVADIA